MDMNRIDLHVHYLPDFYQAALEEAGFPNDVRKWSEEAALDEMEALGVRTSILSISTPGVHFGDSVKAQALARRANEAGAALIQRRPQQFGLFASLPLPDIDASVCEAIYALDDLSVDGVVLQTNSHGMYLGNPKLEPLYVELNRRNAVIFIHPTPPSCLGCESLALGYPESMLEYLFDTTRSVTQMLLSGVTKRHPNLRIIVPHAGAALPVLYPRVALSMSLSAERPNHDADLLIELRRLHYDLAGVPLPTLLPALLSIADANNLHYGSDWPYTPLAMCRNLTDALDTTSVLNEDDRNLVMSANSSELFPRFA